jgi:hypothetical protein
MRKTLTTLLMAVLLSANGMLAQSTPLDRDFQSQEVMTITSPGSTTGLGVYVGPYTANLLTSGATFDGLSVYCVDFEHEVRVGDTWTVNTSGIESGDLSLTRLGSGGLTNYRQAAYLSSLFDSWTDYGSDKSAVWTGIHSAIWTLMGSNPGSNSFTSTFMNLAVQYGTSYNADGWYVLTDAVVATNPDGGKQEFLARTTTVTPEPETYLLLLTGLVAVFGVQGVRRRKNGGAVA